MAHCQLQLRTAKPKLLIVTLQSSPFPSFVSGLTCSCPVLLQPTSPDLSPIPSLVLPVTLAPALTPVSEPTPCCPQSRSAMISQAPFPPSPVCPPTRIDPLCLGPAGRGFPECFAMFTPHPPLCPERIDKFSHNALGKREQSSAKAQGMCPRSLSTAHSDCSARADAAAQPRLAVSSSVTLHRVCSQPGAPGVQIPGANCAVQSHRRGGSSKGRVSLYPGPVQQQAHCHR